MKTMKSSGETLRRYSVETATLPEHVSVVQRVRFEEIHQDGQKITSETTTHQFVVDNNDLKTTHSGNTPPSASRLFLLDPELVDLIPRILDSKPTHLETSARFSGLVKHQMSAFLLPFSAVKENRPYRVFRYDNAYGWFDVARQTYLAQPIAIGPNTGMTAKNYNFKRLLDHLKERDDILFVGIAALKDPMSLSKNDSLIFHYCPNQDTYNRLVARSQQLANAGYPSDLAYAVFDLDPLKLYDAGALKVLNLNHLIGRFDVPNLQRSL